MIWADPQQDYVVLAGGPTPDPMQFAATAAELAAPHTQLLVAHEVGRARLLKHSGSVCRLCPPLSESESLGATRALNLKSGGRALHSTASLQLDSMCSAQWPWGRIFPRRQFLTQLCSLATIGLLPISAFPSNSGAIQVFFFRPETF